MSSSYSIHTGVWINWSHGLIQGATLTLSPRNGALLLSFIAAFVTITGARLWNIISFIWHQLLVRKDHQDGLHYQQRNILRNVTSPGGAAWFFLLQMWHWRGRAAWSFFRTVPWTLLALAYIALFGLLAVFSSQISKSAGSERLIVGQQCGFWLPATPATSLIAVKALTEKAAVDSRTATAYARACYGNTNAPPQCGILPASTLDYSNRTNVACPFDKSLCKNGTAFSVKTSALDSHSDFGINAAPTDRIQYTRELTCAPVVLQGYVGYVTGEEAENMGYDNNTLVKYSYGQVPQYSIKNATYLYNTDSVYTNVGYSVNIAPWYRAGINSTWIPIAALQPARGDLDMIFIAFNSISFEEPCNDTIFSANQLYQVNGTNFSKDYYGPDRLVSPMACVTKHQICNPKNNMCTEGLSTDRLVYEVANIGLTYPQLTTAYRILFSLDSTTFYQNVGPRMSNALRAQDAVSETTQLYLPSNQWQVEVSGWFEDSLARLQFAVQEYATGPSTLTEGSRLNQPWDQSTATAWNVSDSLAAPSYRSQCYSQLTRDTQGTMSFSVVGLIITFTIGGVILILSVCFETLVGLVQRLFHIGEYHRLAWILDSNLQVQRMLYESKGLGTWDGHTDSVPTTTEKERFMSYDPMLEARARSLGRGEEQQVSSGKEAIVQARPLLGRYGESQ